MDRTAWIAIVLSVAGLIGWQFWYQKNYAEPLAEYKKIQAEQAAAEAAETAANQPKSSTDSVASPQQQVTGTATTPAVSISSASESSATTTAPSTVVATAKVAAREETISREDAEFVFTNMGGGLREVFLVDHTVDGEEKIDINQYRSIPIGAIGDKPSDMGADTYEISVDEAANTVTFSRVTAEQIEITKVFTLPDPEATAGKAYQTELSVQFKNLGSANYKSSGYYVSVGSAVPIHESEQEIYTGFDMFRQGKKKSVAVNWFMPGKIPLLGIETRGARPVFSESAPNLMWASVKNQYFATIITNQGQPGEMGWAKRFEVTGGDDDDVARAGIEGAIGMAGFSLAPGEVRSEVFNIYTGPKIYEWVADLGAGQEKILRYGIFEPISLFLLKSMNTLKGYLGSYGLAILALTLIIKTLLFPLQNKATKSMRKMAALGPKMTELKAKHKDDPTKLNQEMMGLYKQYGINPFGGCLPMLFQIPIFFGFYSMLGSAVELRNSSFLWINDLSQPDTVAYLFGGMPLNILPLLMAVTMLWQMMITPKSGDAMQQRMFMFMPLIFVIFCYNFASALALYWTVQNLFSIVQLYLTRDKALPDLTPVAAANTPAPGPKKTKGSNVTKSKKKRKK